MPRVAGPSLAELDRLADAFTASMLAAVASVLEDAAEALPATATVEDLAGLRDGWTARVDQALLGELSGAYWRGVDVIHGRVGRIADQLVGAQVVTAAGRRRFIPRVLAAVADLFLEAARNRLVGVGDEVWEHARTGLLDGFRAGEGIAKLRDRIRAAAGLAAPRAEMIARTEVIGAANQGALAEMSATGLRSTKEWLATRDGRTREEHAAANGQKVPLDQPFLVGGVAMNGPHDPAAPAHLTINCRCTTLFDVTEDQFRIFAVEETLVAAGGDTMPWHIERQHTGCPAGKPWAVVQDADGSVAGCHASETDAEEQLAALYANEPEGSAMAEHEHFGSTDNPVSDAPWDGATSGYTDEQYRMASAACDEGEHPKTSCFLPHHEPDGAISRAGLGAAAGRVGALSGRSAESVARAKAHLRSHYTALDLDVPDSLAATEEEFEALGGKPSKGTKKDKRLTENSYDAETVTAETQEQPAAAWQGVLVVEGVTTGDGREFAAGALDWADLPVPLRWKKEDAHGGEHDVTVAVGRIDEVWRDGNEIWGKGVFDLGSEDGAEAHRRVGAGVLKGVSIDADDIGNADLEYIWPDDSDSILDETGDGEDELIKLLFGQPEKVVFHGGRIRAATLVDIPAFVEAYIALVDEPTAATAPLVASLTVLADEALERPPAAWFADPRLSVLTPIVVTDEGRVYGHAAQWGQCHLGFAGECVAVPREDTFPYFLTGELVCADGSRVAVGQITAGIGHAPIHYRAQPAAEHYDNTAAVVADVTVGNDRHGVWVAGSLRGDVDEARIHALRASGQVSPDWRRIGGQLRMVGLLTVNISGYQVPRARVASGAVQALVATGIPRLGRAPETDIERAARRALANEIAARVAAKRTALVAGAAPGS
jgi:hypothetical protein